MENQRTIKTEAKERQSPKCTHIDFPKNSSGILSQRNLFESSSNSKEIDNIVKQRKKQVLSELIGQIKYKEDHKRGKNEQGNHQFDPPFLSYQQKQRLNEEKEIGFEVASFKNPILHSESQIATSKPMKGTLLSELQLQTRKQERAIYEDDLIRILKEKRDTKSEQKQQSSKNLKFEDKSRLSVHSNRSAGRPNSMYGSQAYRDKVSQFREMKSQFIDHDKQSIIGRPIIHSYTQRDTKKALESLKQTEIANKTLINKLNEQMSKKNHIQKSLPQSKPLFHHSNNK